MAMPKNMPLPRIFKNVLRYHDSATIALPTAGASVGLNYRCNGPYDPDAQVGGHQPLGWDQLAPLYGRATVISSLIRVKYIVVWGSASRDLVQVGLSKSSTGTISGDFNDNAEQPGAVVSTIADNPVVLTKTYNCLADFGVDPLTDDTVGSVVSTTPSREFYFNIFAVSDVVVNVKVEFDIYYNIVWTTPAYVAGS